MPAVPVRKEKSIKQYFQSFDVVYIAPLCPNLFSVYTVFVYQKNIYSIFTSLHET